MSDNATRTAKKKLSKRSSISKNEWHQLVGLLAAHEEQQRVLRAIERAALAIVQEIDHDGNEITENDGGHTTDILWGSRDLRDGLRILGIKVNSR